MKVKICLFFCLLLLGVKSHSTTKVIHVFVALCDNENQGIVPVPKSIGNGQDPHQNLYWGCGYGVRTWFNRDSDWQKLKVNSQPEAPILERCVYKHKTKDVYLVADAYDGAHIKKATQEFLMASAGGNKGSISTEKGTIKTGGGADLVAYVGHNGLMDFSLDAFPKAKDTKTRQAIILACISKSYFKPALKSSGAKPLVWTTGLMAPEAYTLGAAIKGWVNQETDAQVRERAAQAYHQYQKCGINGARNLLVTGW